MEKKGVNELLEAMDGINFLVPKLCGALKDGIQATDLLVLIEVAQNFEVLRDAFAGLKDIPAEIKDIDEAEAGQLLLKVFEIIKNVKAAL